MNAVVSDAIDSSVLELFVRKGRKDRAEGVSLKEGWHILREECGSLLPTDQRVVAYESYSNGWNRVKK